MRILRYFILLCVVFMGCKRAPCEGGMLNSVICACDTSNLTAQPAYGHVQGALLATRFKTLEELKSVIQIEYFGSNTATDSATHTNVGVRVRHCSNGTEVVSELETGITQQDIWNARYGSLWSRFNVLYNSPYSVMYRKELEKIYTLSRWRPEWFGEGDLAFFDIAKSATANINTKDIAFQTGRDSTEKGYLNSFNHLTAQAFITSCFSEDLADFIADAHERYSHPEIITGKFTEAQLNDLDEGPVDNYVDLINNEWGQELGKQLKDKYHITNETSWTPELLANYLNDLQSYYSWAFQIGFDPFKPEDAEVRRFAKKIDAVMKGKVDFKRQ